MEREYSITAEELQEIMELMANGWKCEKFEVDETLYIRCTHKSEMKDFEFVQC